MVNKIDKLLDKYYWSASPSKGLLKVKSALYSQIEARIKVLSRNIKPSPQDIIDDIKELFK